MKTYNNPFWDFNNDINKKKKKRLIYQKQWPSTFMPVAKGSTHSACTKSSEMTVYAHVFPCFSQSLSEDQYLPNAKTPKQYIWSFRLNLVMAKEMACFQTRLQADRGPWVFPVSANLAFYNTSFEKNKLNIVQVNKFINRQYKNLSTRILDLNWSERSACAALGCWHKRSWPL